MTLTNLARQRYQLRHICEFERRDTPKILLASLFVAAVMVMSGHVLEAGLFILAASGLQFVHLMTAMKLPEADADIGWGLIASHWALHIVSKVVSSIPVYVLVFQPEFAYFLLGQLWLFGVLIHLVTAFSLMHFYCWTLILPLLGTGIYAGFLASGRTYYPGDLISFVLLGLGFAAFAINIFETMYRQRDNRKALNSSRAEAEERLAQLEFITDHDALTGLLNRRAFDRVMERALDKATSEAPVALFMVDLDGFKPINDGFGHDIGDTVLKTIGARLRDFADDTGTTARLGGDEFALMRPDLTGETAALNLARQLVAALEKPVSIGDREVAVGASVGVTLDRGSGATTSEVCAEADQAMYRAKALRGGEVVLYVPELFTPRVGLGERTLIENALQDGHIRPFYQAKVRLIDGARHGYEALARWVEPSGTVVPPGEFLPKIEELSLHRVFSNKITSRVLSDTMEMKLAGIDPGRVSLNVSEVSLATQSGLQDFLDQLRKYPQVRENLVVEITEDVVISRSVDSVVNAIETLAETGLEISLDDFGTGYASFQHLRQLRFNELKIDLSFVSELGQSHASDVIVEGFLSIAEGLGARVVAEGIETCEQARLLSAMGCEFGQGYLFGRPVDIARDISRLKRRSTQLRAQNRQVA